MLQRVLCAMSICCSPLWLLADEPTKGLDETACGVVYENLQKIKTSQVTGYAHHHPPTYRPGTFYLRRHRRYVCRPDVEYGPQVLHRPTPSIYPGFLGSTAGKRLSAAAWPAAITAGSFARLSVCAAMPQLSKTCLQEVPPVYDSGTAKVRCFLYA